MREDWAKIKFEDITLSIKRGPFGGDLKKSFFVESGYKVYEQQHAIRDDHTLGHYYIDEDRYNKLKSCNLGPGDYIVSCSGTIGRISKLPEKAELGIMNQALMRIRINEDVINGKYFIELFRSGVFQKKILKEKRGSGMQNLAGIKEIKPIPINLPPLPEQRAIVAKIEELFSELDNGIANLKKAQAQLKVYRQAVLKKAFEGELTREWREQQTNLPKADELLAEIKEEREEHYQCQLEEWKAAVQEWESSGKNGKKPTRPTKIKETRTLELDEVQEFDRIPDLWAVTEIQSIADKVTDGTHHTPTYTDSGVRFVSVKDIYNEQVHFDQCKYISLEAHNELIKRCNPEQGDLLITKSGTIGRLAIVPDEEFSLFVSVALLKMQSTKHLFHPKWIYYSAKYHLAGLNIAQDIKGGLLKNYHLEDLRLAKLIIVPLEEQHQIVQEIESRLSVCDKVEESIEQNLQKSEALRQSILKKAFEGKLLTDQELEECRKEPDWEPAEVLLERIKNSDKLTSKKH